MGSIGNGQSANLAAYNTAITCLDSIKERVRAVNNADSATLDQVVDYLKDNLAERWMTSPQVLRIQLSSDFNILFALLGRSHHGSLDELIRILQENLSVTMGTVDPRNLSLYLPTLGGFLESLQRAGKIAPWASPPSTATTPSPRLPTAHSLATGRFTRRQRVVYGLGSM